MLATATALAIVAVGALAHPAVAKEPIDQGVRIATGQPGGLYHPIGNAMCRLLNLELERHRLHCVGEHSPGSIANLESLRAGEIDFALVQSDVEHAAFVGEAPFDEAGAFEGLRAILMVHEEPYTVVARIDSGIKSQQDLPGTRVGAGDPRSGHRFTGERMIAAHGWTDDDFARVVASPPDEAIRALCAGELDAVTLRVGHPNGWIQEVTRSCDVALVPVKSEVLDSVLASRGFYHRAIIPGGLYRGNPDPVVTFGARALLVTTARQSSTLVQELTRAVVENFETFRRLHPTLYRLTREDLVPTGVASPLHPAAQAYFLDAGLLPAARR